jgi:ribose transport system ATP-binding protein
MNQKIILEMRNVSKQFPGVLALDDVSFSCYQGEVHAIVGENGAGKSTLMKILSGAYTPDTGQIFIDGEEVIIHNPHHGQDLGVNIIYQEFNLIPYLDIAENIFIGRKPTTKLGLIDYKKMYKLAKEDMEQIGIDIDLKKWISELTVAEQQIVEIIKAVSFTSKIVIMDEPTSALSEDETQQLFGVIKKLVARNITVIFISHRIREIFEIADRVTVLKDSKFVTTKNVNELTESKLVNLMVGRELSKLYPPKNGKRKDLLVSVKNLTRKGVFKDISFDIYKGEIVGLAGLVGAGRTEVARAIFGADQIESGEISINGNHVKIRTPRDAVSHGMGLIPEDRRSHGLVLCLSIRNNIVISILGRISNVLFTNKNKEKQIVNQLIDQLSIKTPTQEFEVQNLSGGNQQKVVLAKWLAVNLQLIIFDEPTRGIDVGAKAEIHRFMRELANKGAGILMISSELPEILGMSDRIVVMCEGEITGVFEGEDLNEERIMHAATGVCKG